jgi:two-component system NtrC family sensor kinase
MSQEGGLTGIESSSDNGIKMSIATKLILSFLLIIILTSAIFTVVGITAISSHIKSDAQEQAREVLDNARDIYMNRLGHVNSVVRSAGQRSLIREAVSSGQVERSADELEGIRILEALDILTVTDEYGNVLFRASNPDLSGDNKGQDELVQAVMKHQMPAAATTIITAEDLAKESPLLAEKAYARFADSPEARQGLGTEEFENMMLGAAAPIFDAQNGLTGIVYGGVLLNGNQDLACEIKQAVFSNTKYNGKDVGFVSIYQDDLGIATCPRVTSVTGGIGSQFDEDTYREVIESGRLGIGREEVMDAWYVTAFQPIRSADFETVGILQVGTLEKIYVDIRNHIIVSSLAITLGVALVATLFAYFISQRISIPLKKLVTASRDVARGELDARVDIQQKSNDELGELAEAFNAMASALEERDERLKELTQSRIRRSERLAMIGKLSANVAHELNNPLQGIVTYSHLLLERMPVKNPETKYVEVIVTQANRCRDIIRGLLDFARQREPNKTLSDVNIVLQESMSLLENQALFHNVNITKEFDATLPPGIIDPSQIERVFMNIIINAAEAMDGSGQLALRTRYDSGEGFIDILFEDTGNGIAEEDVRRIFDPFFTTKEIGHGTGLGLAISYGIVQEHGGTILVKSVIGSGTTFTVRLPVTSERDQQVELDDQNTGAESAPREKVLG